MNTASASLFVTLKILTSTLTTMRCGEKCSNHAFVQPLDEMGVDYFEAEGEAAFYGPKLDIQVKTALGKEETLSTIQLDFLLPERFDLKYIGADGEEHRPVMIHRGVIWCGASHVGKAPL